jgi:structural maintenance of chromosome 3 (chondroitin sulfate proteoglycan 6)
LGAVSQVFGKTLVCRNLDVAARVARETSLNCVTMEGDQVERRGTFRGGYYDASRSRIQAMKEVKVRAGADAAAGLSKPGTETQARSWL